MQLLFLGTLRWAVVSLALSALPVLAADSFITLASTTSTQASGFFDYYLPLFKKKSGIEVHVVAVGTGQAIKLGEKGDADVLLVHDKIGELQFVEKGYGVDRREVMYNDFVIVGPEKDPAGIRAQQDAVSDFQKLATSKQTFVSRGDDSGTHRLELRLWKEAGIDPKKGLGKNYKEVGSGMGATLNTTVGLNAYTLSDRASWVTFKNRGELALLDEGDKKLFNQYSVILVNPAKHKHVKKDAGLAFMDWMTSSEGQAAIAAFQVEGQVLFKPNAAAVKKMGTE